MKNYIRNIFESKNEFNTSFIDKNFRIYKKISSILDKEIGSFVNKFEIIKILNYLLLIEIIYFKIKKTKPLIDKIYASDNKFILILEFINQINTPINQREKCINNIVPFLPISDSEINYNFIIKDNILEKIFLLMEKMNLEEYLDTNDYKINILLGGIFEKHINKKESGAYYTDYSTTNYILQNTISPYFINSILNKKGKEIEIENLISKNISLYKVLFDEIDKLDSLEFLIKSIDSIKILDPAVGSGAFIINSFYLLDELYKKLGVIDQKRRFIGIFTENLFGIDIDNESIELLKYRIIVESLNLKTPLKSKDFNNIFINFLKGNSLNGCIHKKDATKWNKKIKDIIKTGGFTCVVGNPPYVEYKKIKTYTLENIKSIKCGNLYAFTLEKSMKLLSDNGFLGMIVPISYISTPRMKPIRTLLLKNSNYHFISSFADRPSTLFNGVHQKLNIILLNKNSNTSRNKIYTTNYIHFNKENKKSIFSNLHYTENKFNTNFKFLFKVGNNLEHKIIDKIFNSSAINLIDNIDQNGSYSVWLNMRLLFWNKTFLKKPKSKEYKEFKFTTYDYAIIFASILNSNLFFFFWETISDGWHITNKDLINFKINFKDIDESDIKLLKKVYLTLEDKLEETKVKVNTSQIAHKYQHKNVKYLIDKIDLILDPYSGLHYEESVYVKNYQSKYRMNNKYKG